MASPEWRVPADIASPVRCLKRYIRSFMSSARRRQCGGLSWAELLASLGDTDLDRRDAAMLAMPCMLALRCSELVEIDFEQRGDAADAGLAVLRMTDHSLELQLLRSKASQEKPVTIAVDRQHNPRAFAALERWIQHAVITPGAVLSLPPQPAGGLGGRITAITPTVKPAGPL